MNPVANPAPLQALYDRYVSVLDRLTALAESDARLLAEGARTLPLTAERETLVRDYATLSVAVTQHIWSLQAAGLLTSDDLEARIRHLSSVTKDNQRRLARQARQTARRVDSVMHALTADRDVCNDNTTAISGGVAPDTAC